MISSLCSTRLRPRQTVQLCGTEEHPLRKEGDSWIINMKYVTSTPNI